MRKILSFLLMLMIVFSFSSCFSSDNAETDDGSYPTDLGGYECIIMHEDLVKSEKERFSYLKSDFIRTRIEDISNKWNCTITVTTNAATLQSILFSTLMGGGYACEIAYTSAPGSLTSVGMLYPLSKLTGYIDYTNAEKFGGLGILEQGVYESEPYTVSPVLWPGKQVAVDSFGIFAVNEDLIKRYGKTDPRDYVENGKWTWDNFEEIIRSYQIYDGSTKATALNITWSVLDFAMMNGADYVSFNDNGTVYPSIDSPAITETLDWCYDLFSHNSECVTFYDHSTMLPKFIGNEIVLTQTSVDHVIRFMSYDSDYGIVPMPCGPRGTYGEWKNTYSENTCLGILVNAKKPKYAAIIIDELCEPIEDYGSEKNLREFFNTYFMDERDIDIIFSVFENSRWNYSSVASVCDFFESATDELAKGRSSSEILSRYADSANLSVGKEIVPNYEFIRQYEENAVD